MTWDFLSLLSSWTMSKKQRFTFNRSNEIFKKKTSKFEWTLNDIRIEKTISPPIWATKLCLKVSPLLDVRHCPKLQSCPISRKTYDATLRKWQTFFMVLPLLVVRHVPSYHPIQFQGKLMNQTWKDDQQKTDFGPDFADFVSTNNCSKLSSYAI